MTLPSLRPLAVLGLSFALAGLTGCSAGGGAEAPAPEGVMDEAELRSPSFSGTYAANTNDDSDAISGLRVEQRGPKLVVVLDEYGGISTFDLQKTRSGAYVFTSGEMDGECDDPGCSYTVKISGVVYLKKVGTKKVPSAKITVTRLHPYPESEGDLEGEQATTYRWTKKAR